MPEALRRPGRLYSFALTTFLSFRIYAVPLLFHSLDHERRKTKEKRLCKRVRSSHVRVANLRAETEERQSLNLRISSGFMNYETRILEEPGGTLPRTLYQRNLVSLNFITPGISRYRNTRLPASAIPPLVPSTASTLLRHIFILHIPLIFHVFFNRFISTEP